MRLFIAIFLSVCGLFLLLGNTKKGKLTPYQFPSPVAFPTLPQSAENPVTQEGVDLGRYLFYDSILSNDNTISCSTCHQQKYAFSNAPNQFSIGINQTKQQRNTPPLFNLAWYPKLFWDGRAASIEEQVFFPVRDHSEMNLSWDEAAQRIEQSRFYKKKFKLVFGDVPIDSVLIAKAIGQFERTLISYNSKFDRVLRKEDKLSDLELRGFEIMNDQSMADCLHCHSSDANALTTSLKFSNNGLDSITDAQYFSDFGLGLSTGRITDYGKFKIPSLRNIALTGPYMHDGRFKTLKEVIDFYSEGLKKSPTIDSKMTRLHQGGVHLSEYDKLALEAFLNSLTDSVFIANPEFSDPFKK